MKILTVILISYAGIAGAVSDSEYQIANDWNIDTGIACSNAMGAHQFNINSRRLQVSGALAMVGGQRCSSVALGKRMDKRIFGHMVYGLIRGDESFTLQSTYEF